MDIYRAVSAVKVQSLWTIREDLISLFATSVLRCHLQDVAHNPADRYKTPPTKVHDTRDID